MLSFFSHVWLFEILRTVACQALLSMRFSRQEYLSGFPSLLPADLPDTGIKPMAPAAPEWQADSFPQSHWTVALEKTPESPLDFREIQPVHSKGNQSWIFIWRTDTEAETPVLWLPDVKNWLIGKEPDAGKDWRQEEKGMTRMKWLDGIIDSVDMRLGKLQ